MMPDIPRLNVAIFPQDLTGVSHFCLVVELLIATQRPPKTACHASCLSGSCVSPRHRQPDVTAAKGKDARATTNVVERSHENGSDRARPNAVEQPLWDRAYNLLGQEHEELVVRYEGKDAFRHCSTRRYRRQELEPDKQPGGKKEPGQVKHITAKQLEQFEALIDKRDEERRKKELEGQQRCHQLFRLVDPDSKRDATCE
ncbi:hypothetical protein QBC34DRAFT_386352 [Podospora aff. communis PSN243]|uniref:Uncharacterized protein n=1 Tax=Podospora aff. communis PSN243 TaxID=3040156 RepID=A0AAV9G7J9_9PEZI|nr:hypothetical protein QBC34DRAFT_386352 [Podospora aff. communis PSN243]